MGAEGMEWAAVFLAIALYALAVLLVPIAVTWLSEWRERRMVRAYLGDATRKRLALHDDDTGPLTCSSCDERECTPEACGASSWRRAPGGGL